MSTGITVLIVAIVVIAIAVVVALVLRARKQRQRTTRMRLPELGALSTDGLDKQHAGAHRDRSPDRPQQPSAGS